MAVLKHELRGRHLFTLAFGTIVGVGWITVLGHLLGGGSLGAVIAFAVGGLLMLSVGLCYAEVTSMMPAAGGEVVYAYRTFGPSAGFAAGWILSLIYISVTAFEAISVGWILTVLVPGLEGPVVYEVFGAQVSLGSLLVGLIGMFSIGYLNYRGALIAARFQDVMTYGLIVVSLVFIGAGLTRGSVDNLHPLFSAPDFPGALTGIVTVFVTTPFWFAGFNVLPQAVGEKSSNVSLAVVGRLILLSILGALFFYVLVILASAMTLPRDELLALELPAAAAFRVAFDSVILGNLVLLAGLFGLITTWNAVFFSAARVLLALSDGRGVPSALGFLHPRHGTPSRAVLLVSVLGTLLMLLGRGTIGLIVNTVGTCFALMFISVAITLIHLRLREPRRERPYRVPGGFLVPVVALTFSIGMVAISLWEHSRNADGFPPEWIVLVIWALFGFVLWLSTAAGRRRVANAQSSTLDGECRH